jgi:hypothetical protein
VQQSETGVPYAARAGRLLPQWVHVDVSHVTCTGEMEQPYIRCHERVTVAVLARFLQERMLSAAPPGDQTVSTLPSIGPCAGL